MKKQRIKWVGHIACTEEMGNAYKTLVKKPEGKGLHRLHGRIILEWIFKK
jgi:hypothetical protein